MVSDDLDQTVTLKFGAANYIADAWLNGHYLGYHEGGSTPFAFDVTDFLNPADVNTLAVRVDNPRWGTRQDIVPWGLTDWWNYGGLTQPVWLEATAAIYAPRADVIPHLDGADVFVTLHQRRGTVAPVQVDMDILPATVDPSNATNPDPRALVPDAALPLASERVDAGQLAADGTKQVHASFSLTGSSLWTPQSPALYVLEVRVFWDERRVDQLFETFGLRRVAVDAKAPRLLLNGDPVSFAGVALHDERVYPGRGGQPQGGPVTTAGDVLVVLQKANSANAQLIRADHHPANPLLLMLADRLGYAIWEEIPLYHYTPATFTIAMDRGIPQQMLTEMDLRDMNHPSVLFHGLANESTGGSERRQALTILHNLDRRNDGTRLTGQAAYGSQPDDPTSAPLDVAGYTAYYGVFYRPDATPGTAHALAVMHATFPKKPVMILEFGRWADDAAQQEEQRRILADTYAALVPVADTNPDGFVGAAVWWTLDDYWTQRPGVKIEHFGLYTPNGDPRPAGLQASARFGGGAGQGLTQKITSTGSRAASPAGPRRGSPDRLPGLRLDRGARDPSRHPFPVARRAPPRPTAPGALMHQVSGRVVGLSVRAAMIAGAWIAFARRPYGRLRGGGGPLLVCRCGAGLAVAAQPDPGGDRAVAAVRQPGSAAGGGSLELVPGHPVGGAGRRGVRGAGRGPDRRAGRRLLQPVTVRRSGGRRGARPAVTDLSAVS